VQKSQIVSDKTFACLMRVLFAALMTGVFPIPSFANWWIVRSSDEKCLVVDIEPVAGNKDVTKIGKESYPTAEEAEADRKRVCRTFDAGTPC
jgi:hypothetical protein